MRKFIIAFMALLMLGVTCACAARQDAPAPEAAAADGVVLSELSVSGGESAGARYMFGMSYDGTDSNIYSELPEGYYDAGTTVTAHAVCAEDAAFYCWSLGGYLTEGGTPVSYAKDYTFPLERDTWLYANFRAHDTALVLYHANGGTVLNDDGSVIETASGEANADAAQPDLYWAEFSLAYFLYPNALPDMGYFQREGYSLIGYSTEPDGSGEFYNVGGKVFEDTQAVIELYCVWSEDSPAEDFTLSFDRNRNGYNILAYNGADEAVSIPSYYNGSPVVGVAAGAFTGCDTVTSLVFPSTMRCIDDYACNSCANLKTVYLFDSLDYLSDLSFDGDYALTTVYFGAATNPRYTNWFNNHSKKVEIMNYWKDSERPLMICLGGSSTTYALDAEQLESLLDRDYLVLNCGSNGANLFTMTSEWAMHFLREGDFLLQIIEYSGWQLGGVECRWESFRSFESCYNIYSWVTASKFTKFFDSFHDYLDARKSQPESTYENFVSTLAPNGYYDIQGTLNVVTRPNGSDTFWQGRRIYFCDNFLYQFMLYYSNVQYWKLDQMGVDYAMAFTPLNRNSLYDYQTDAAMEDFENYLASNLNVDIISDLQENIYEPAVFFDDDYHLAAPARAEYTAKLAEDMNAYFAEADAAE